LQQKSKAREPPPRGVNRVEASVGFSKKENLNAGFDHHWLKEYEVVAIKEDLKKPERDALIGFSEKKPKAVVPPPNVLFPAFVQKKI